MATPGHTPSHAREQSRPLAESDLSSDIMGNNQLQGDDQESVHNQRHSVPDAKAEPDADPVESAKLQDKDTRAERELNKGGGVHPGAADDAAPEDGR